MPSKKTYTSHSSQKDEKSRVITICFNKTLKNHKNQVIQGIANLAHSQKGRDLFLTASLRLFM